MLQLVVCNIGSDYNDSLYVVIPEEKKKSNNKKRRKKQEKKSIQHVIWTTRKK